MRAIINTALTAAVALSSMVAGCGEGDTSPMCDPTNDPRVLTVNAVDSTCGVVAYEGTYSYTFAAVAAAQHTVSVVSSYGNANLCFPVISPPLSGSFACPLNEGSEYDVLVFMAQAGATYEVTVVGGLVTSSSPPSGEPAATSSYGIRVTSP
ncbi:MAG TPA: hypothetical protein VFR85_11325 [Anaeromyxobacteraceae bacterium]|nr:hypothetical protein [Anaeromyxobacteraceae bacterium]